MTRRTFEEYRSQGALASLDEDWLNAVESSPSDLDWFLGVAEGLAGAGEEEHARSLIELYDAELAERDLWSLRLELLRRAGTLVVRPSRLQREVVATLEALWRDRPNLGPAIEFVGLHKSTEDPVRLWDKVTRLQSLLVFDVGEVVLMQGQGVGRVVEVNLPLESLKIDFEKRSGVTVGLRAAAKLLKALPPGHLLRRKLEEPAELERLRDQDPPGLLRALLETSDRPLTAGEIREALAGLVPESKWTGWWAVARRHPQVVTSTGGRQTYRWEASEKGALEAVRRAFAQADPRGKAELLRKHAERDTVLAREMAGDLASIAGESGEGDPGLALELWFGLERLGFLPPHLDELPETLLGPAGDARRLLAGVTDRLLRERALTMLRQRRQDWVALWRDQMVREEEPKVLDLLFAGLRDVDPEGTFRIVDDVLAQPRRAPAAFSWLAERAADDEQLRGRNPLRLLQQLLAALSDPEFSRQRARLRPLADSGGTVPRLLASLDQEQAAAALEAVRRAPGLEAYQRDALVAALELRFSALRAEAPAHHQPLYATVAAIAAKQAELKRLSEVDIPANRKAIAEARAHGDLRENFEYKAARERHEYLNARVAALHRDLRRARPIDFGNLDLGEVRVGTRVVLENRDAGRLTYTVLGPWESRPEDNVLSYESELGQRLLGLKTGGTIEIAGATLTVAAIEPAG
jgi:transcription elongation GreA/GreB family factor